MHHFFGIYFGDIADGSLLVGILTSAQFAFHIHEVTLGVIASTFGNVVGEVTPNHDVVPVGLFHPIVITVAVTF